MRLRVGCVGPLQQLAIAIGRLDAEAVAVSMASSEQRRGQTIKLWFVALYCSAENRHSTGSLSWLRYFSWGLSNSFRHLKSWLLGSIDELALVPHHPAVVGVFFGSSSGSKGQRILPAATAHTETHISDRNIRCADVYGRQWQRQHPSSKTGRWHAPFATRHAWPGTKETRKTSI